MDTAFGIFEMRLKTGYAEGQRLRLSSTAVLHSTLETGSAMNLELASRPGSGDSPVTMLATPSFPALRLLIGFRTQPMIPNSGLHVSTAGPSLPISLQEAS